MRKKTVLLMDDEQGFLEPLSDALEYEGYRVLKATTAEEGLRMLEREHVDLVTIDVMMPPGPSLEKSTNSQTSGILVCKEMRNKYPAVDAFCISVINDWSVIREIESFGVKFLRKGETPLRTVLNMIRSRLTGVAYSTERGRHGQRR